MELDQLHHRADALGGGGEAAHGPVGARQVAGGPVGRFLGGGHLVAGARDQCQQVARRDADGLHIAGGVGRGIGRRRRAQPHVLATRAKVGGGHANLFARLVEGGHHLVDRGPELLRDEGVAGKVELGFRFAAAVGDRQRIGIDQGLPHPLGGRRDLGHGAAADPLREGGITVAGGDLRDRFDHQAQTALDPPCRRQPCRERHRRQPAASFRWPKRRELMYRMRAGWGIRSIPPAPDLEFRMSFRNIIENCRSFDETACFRLPKPFPWLRCTE